MSIQGVNRVEAYFAAHHALSVPYVKAEQDCGLQGCFRAVCRAISIFASCLFKTLCCCCCVEENDERAAVQVPVAKEPPHPISQIGSSGSRSEVESIEESGKSSEGDVPDLETDSEYDPTLDLKLELHKRDVYVLPLGTTLHQDIVLNIFSHWDMKTIMVTFSVVCKGWYALAKDIYQGQLQSKKCLTMQELAICGKRLYGPQFAELKRLGVNIWDWETIFKLCGQLEALDFSGVFEDIHLFDRMTYEWASKLFERQGKTAQEITLMTQRVAKFCPHFKILNFSGCSGLAEVSDELLNALDHVPTVTHLNLASCDLSLDRVFDFVKRLPDLISLDVEVKGSNTFKVLGKIAECCPKLRRLKISSRGDLPVFRMLSLAKKCQFLTHLSIKPIKPLGPHDRRLFRAAGCHMLASCANLVFFHYPFAQDLDLRLFELMVPNVKISSACDVDFFLDETEEK
jgi:hypothetical protein